MTTVLDLPKKRGGGRPPMHHDNSRVQSFLRKFVTTKELLTVFPRLDDVLIGAGWLQTVGEAHERPLSKGKLIQVLRGCEVIETQAVTSVLAARQYSPPGKSTVARYAAAARVASKSIDRLLDEHPGWESYEGAFGLWPGDDDLSYSPPY